MSKLTTGIVPAKITGSQFTASEFESVRTIINNNDDELIAEVSSRTSSELNLLQDQYVLTYAAAVSAATGTQKKVITVETDETASGATTSYLYRGATGVLIPLSKEVSNISSNIPSIYVDSVGGSNGNDGLTQTTPVASVAYGASLVPEYGTLYIKCNGLFRETLDISSKIVTIKSYGSGEKPRITGADVATGWTLESGNVWYKDVTVEIAAGNRGYAGIWEDDIRLTEYVIGDGSTTNLATMVVLLQANPNSFYFTGVYASGWAAGTQRYYIHTSDGTNPNTNSKTYEANKRNYVIVHNGATIEGLQLDKCQHHDGVIVGGFLAGQITNCLLKDFGRHGIIDPSSSMTDCLVTNGNPKYPGGFYHPYSSSTSALTTAPRYLRCIAENDDITVSGFVGFFGHGPVPGAAPTHEKVVFTDCKAIGLSEGFGNFDVNYLEYNNCESFFCGTDFSSTGFIQTTLNSCTSTGTSACAVLLPLTGNKLYINNSKFATALAVTNKAPFYIGGSAGEIYLNNVELSNQGSNPVGSILQFIVSTGSISKLSIRNTYLSKFNGEFDAVLKATAVTTFDIPDNELLVGGISANTIINGVTANISTNSGVGVVQVLSPKKLYENFPLTADFTKRVGTNYPITYGSNAIVGETFLQPRGIIYYGNKVYKDQYGTGNTVEQYTPTSELLSGFFTTSTAFSSGYHVGVGKSGLIVRSNDLDAAWQVVGAGVTTQDLYAGASAGAFATVSDLDIAVGNNGVILKSVNNGSTWTALTSGVTTNLRGVAIATILSVRTILVVGESGTILKSIDDGLTWAAVTSGVTVTLNKIVFGNSLFVIVGDASSGGYGTILTSTDAVTFSARISNTYKSIKSIHYANNVSDSSQNKFIATLDESGLNNESLIQSVNGTTWSVLNVLVPFEVTGIGYYSNQLGWLLSGKTSAGIGNSFDANIWNFANSVPLNLTKLYEYKK